MKNALASLILMALLPATYASASEEVAGEWSAVHDYLEARFIARQERSNGQRSEIVLYLELRNTCPREGTVLRIVGLDPATNITYQVTDEHGVGLKPEFPVFRDTIRLGFYKLALPPDSNLRFPISVSGGSGLGDRTKLDVAQPKGIWFFARTNHGEYKLSGVLTIPRQRGSSNQFWEGKLELPPVRLPLGQAGVQAVTAPNAGPPHREH
jgi:hypothetical protein